MSDETNAAAEAHWSAEARKRVTEHPGLETMTSRSYEVPYSTEEVWSVIAPVRHWEADAFHNAIVEAHDFGRAGSYFEMTHTNHPIIPWPMADQTFMGVIMDYDPGRRQSVAELNVSDAEKAKRTPDHQQIIELEAIGPQTTRMTYTVATVRIDGISAVTRFFFRPWARYQIGRAIRKKYNHILSDLRSTIGARA